MQWIGCLVQSLIHATVLRHTT